MKTFGTIDYDAGRRTWVIQAEPHVQLRIKRVFNKIDKHQHDRLALSATEENSRDLRWFLERYPMKVLHPELLDRLADRHVEEETVLHRLLSGVQESAPFDLKLPPRPYQSLAARLWMTSKGLLLADDLGLGKTVSAICGLTEPGTLPCLVVCPTHLPRQWQRELEKFTGLSVHVLTQGQPYDLTKRCGGKFPDVIISNYHKLSGWASTLAPAVRSVIFDEVQELRHRGSQKYAAASKLASHAAYRIGLSATPIFNYGGEIFNIMEVLRPGHLGTEAEFLREWCTQTYNGKPRLIDPVGFGGYARSAGLMLRRTTLEVDRELPRITIVPHQVQADPNVLLAMKGRATELARIILQQQEDFRGQARQARGEFDMRLRQATGLAKAPYVAEFVKFLHRESGKKVVLYGWHRDVYSIWMENLKELKPAFENSSNRGA